MKATFLKCRNILIAFSTTSLCESILNTQGNDLGHSNNEEDWTIRSQAPKCEIASIWRRFRDYNGMGLRKLATFDDNLRDSPSSNRNIWDEFALLGRVSIFKLSKLKQNISVKNNLKIFILYKL